MQPIPIRTTVIGSYPFPGWLEFATQNLNSFGAADIEEMIEDAVIAAIHDQVAVPGLAAFKTHQKKYDTCGNE